MALQETFVSNMKRLRKEKGITQERLAELCGTDTCYISQIETLRRFPSIQLIEKLADALGVDAGVLFTSKNTGMQVSEKEKIKGELVKEFEKMLTKVFSA